MSTCQPNHQAPPPAPGSSQLSRHLPGGQPEAHHRDPGHLGCNVRGVPGPQVDMAAGEAVRSPGQGAGAVLQEEGDGGVVQEAPPPCQAAGGPGAKTGCRAGWC
ncbi:hypothetical protein HaLaN_28235, partial [Haematococcus lacustris]